MATIDAAWAALRTGLDRQPQPSDADSFRIRRLEPDSPLDIFGAIDGLGRLLFAVGSSSKPPAFDFDTLAIDCFRYQRVDKSWLLIIRLNDQTLAEVFGYLCDDLVGSLGDSSSESDLMLRTRRRLDLWKKLFDKSGQARLAEFQIQGLLAELTELDCLLERGDRSPSEVIMGWVGPLFADQDFVFASESFEVKSVHPGARTVSINSLGQLDAPSRLQLVVYTSRRAVRGESDVISMNMLVARIEAKISVDPTALTIYRDRLSEAGYSEDPAYDEVAFAIVAREAFNVVPAFPALVTSSSPAGIVAAQYDISLDFIRRLQRD